MTDSLPRLYRSLEKCSGSGDLDRVVMAAVASYIAMRQPGEIHARNLARLVIPSWPRLAGATQAEVASHLALSSELPADLRQTLATAPITIIGPDDLPPPDADMRAAHPAPVAARPATPAADAARTTLRHLAMPGQPSETAATEKPASPTNLRSGIAEALGRLAAADRFAALARWAGIEPAFARRMAEDASGFLPAVALKAIGAHTDDAMAAILLLVPALALDADAFVRLTRDYRDLSREESRSRLGLLAIVEPLHAAPRSRRPQREPEMLAEPGDRRRVFGRRRTAPVARHTFGT